MSHSSLTVFLQANGPPHLPQSHPPMRATCIPPILVAKTRAQPRLLSRYHIPIQPTERWHNHHHDREPIEQAPDSKYHQQKRQINRITPPLISTIHHHSPRLNMHRQRLAMPPKRPVRPHRQRDRQHHQARAHNVVHTPRQHNSPPNHKMQNDPNDHKDRRQNRRKSKNPHNPYNPKCPAYPCE